MARTVSRRWRDYLQFGLRGMITVILGIAIWLGGFARGVHIQRDAVSAIEDAGGIVGYDWYWGDYSGPQTGKPPWPKWLVDRLGADCFGSVGYVGFWYTPVSNAACVHIGHLGQLDSLSFFGGGLTDAGLASLTELKKLKSLDMEAPDVTDAGLRHLKGLTKLQRLSIQSAPITDAGLMHLRGLTGLKQLYLLRTGVTDEGVEQLERALPRLMVYVVAP